MQGFSDRGSRRGRRERGVGQLSDRRLVGRAGGAAPQDERCRCHAGHYWRARVVPLGVSMGVYEVVTPLVLP